MPKRRAITTILVFAMVAALPSAGLAFTVGSSAADLSASFCIEAGFDLGTSGHTVSESKAEALLQDAIANWHVAPGKNDDQALNLKYHDPCIGTTDWTVEAGTIEEGYRAATEDGSITFQDALEWWDGSDSRQTDEWSFEGVLTHEIGHAFGLGHAGNDAWTFDGSAYPTMAQCGDQAIAADFVNIEQDDWGGASWTAPGIGGAYFNANPGFEKAFTHWYRSSTSAITHHSSYAYTGDLGARFASSGTFIYMTSVYDPWIVEGKKVQGLSVAELVNGMDNSPLVAFRTYYRHTLSATTGGLEPMWASALVIYDPDYPCKVDGYVTTTSFSSPLALTGCGDKGTTWSTCTRNKGFSAGDENGLNPQGVAIRSYFKSTSSGAVYMDKTGVFDNSG